MSTYNTETVNTQFMNQSFLDKIDQGLTKEAGLAMSAFVRQRLREDGFARKILPPIPVTAAELDRQLTEEPTIICEKEPDSVASTMSFLGRSNIRYWTTARYPVTFEKISSANFQKSKFELLTYRTDIRTVLQDNSVKDMQEQEDLGFYNNIVANAALNSNANTYTIAGGFTKSNYLAGIKKLLQNRLPVGGVLMTQSMYNDMLAFPATDVGSDAASELFMGRGTLQSPYGYKIITTNKLNILPANQMIVFAPPEYLGQFYTLQDATIFLKVEQDMISFQSYSALGVGIGNVNAAVVINF
jgi:hypothetical protein